MRTDCTVDTTISIRCPQIPVTTAGRPSSVTVGDWVEWNYPDSDIYDRGRVIGQVTSDDMASPHICVAMEMLGGMTCERWIDPEWVVNTAWNHDHSLRGAWLYGRGFFKSVFTARKSFDLLDSELPT